MVKNILFRLIRNTLVLLLRQEGMTWAAINRVLKATGQKVVGRVEPNEKGYTIHYTSYNPEKGLKSKF